MKSIYIEVFAELSGEMFIQQNNSDGSICVIPTDPANSDYQAYLATLVTESAPTA